MSRPQKGLQEQWRDLVLGFGVNLENADRIYYDLLEHYSEPTRSYHDLRHLSEMFRILDDLSGTVPDDRGVRLAVWFHDAIYDSRAKDNEERSAAWARGVLEEWGLSLGERVATLIGMTRTHEAPEEDKDASLLLDADLAILGAPRDRYDEYALAIRREYAWVPEVEYRTGRSRVLSHFLSRARLYRLEAMHVRLDRQARSNLARELALLSDP